MITTALTVIAYGSLLGVGFWSSKKVTNQIDYWLYTHSKKYKDLVKQQVQKDMSPIEEICDGTTVRL